MSMHRLAIVSLITFGAGEQVARAEPKSLTAERTGFQRRPASSCYRSASWALGKGDEHLS